MIEIIRQKLNEYNVVNTLEEENALKEILQEIALHALWRADFFERALFQGGTCLRILNGLPRFSENLDFILREPNPSFELQPYLKTLSEVFNQFGLRLEIISKERMDSVIREAVIKDTAIARQLDLSFANSRHKTIKIKLEIDTNPPVGSTEAKTYLDFPTDYEVRHQDLASNFALKIHALLCRPYVKGRDWFDFSWYVARRVVPNLTLLSAALRQKGPWAGQSDLDVDINWLKAVLTEKIDTIVWSDATEDVRRFLRASEAKTLDLWGAAFFHASLQKILPTIP
ncbi:nucleotidyl transferase AbiEii/AbiGii toxin family protein [Asticcacaulis sp. DXS10W]|uniref:Nucleotidyl transferase AbiEii/AbiGii toxin family protein n=1 Tax=Asticcacaulis currens TaxID=2984210 RepID=A0ABT5IA27_9CAUL|nr:nucleotidyl transferase AbiEii/AbiGii toxin family protein [Asticcacaulis currens]MDC7692877.1 nucleotidyl transferase AbiEii/AbiGii toxin family protein [Asticcacaulis currens]